MHKARIKPARIAAVGIANQRETTAVWARDTGEPIHRAIVWQDRRTALLCQELKDRGLEPAIRRKTELGVSSRGLALDFSQSQTALSTRITGMAVSYMRA